MAPSSAIVEPDKVAGLRLGTTKEDAIAVLGPPTSDEQVEDTGGNPYVAVRWNVSDTGGLNLNFREGTTEAPLLTDWVASAPGPETTQGIQVGDPEEKVTSAYGELQEFCCDANVASLSRGDGRMIIVVGDQSHTVEQIIGGDEASWSRLIAD